MMNCADVLLSVAVSGRANASVPPAGNGTTIVTGLLGQLASAWAKPAAASAAIAVMAAVRARALAHRGSERGASLLKCMCSRCVATVCGSNLRRHSNDETARAWVTVPLTKSSCDCSTRSRL